MSLQALVQAKREDILRIASDYGAYDVRIFGSVARGEVYYCPTPKIKPCETVIPNTRTAARPK
jgi:hypothetical protein